MSRSRIPSCALMLAVLGGCDQAMSRQPKRLPLQPSAFFSDGRSSRPSVPGTIPQGGLEPDRHVRLGMIGAEPADTFPFAVSMDVLDRGRRRFDIFCSPCHDRTGGGNGRIVQRGFRRPPSLHDERLRRALPGQLFAVVTHGLGAMPSYEAQIPPRDRWAIVAYIRALQESRNARADDLPPEELRRLESEP